MYTARTCYGKSTNTPVKLRIYEIVRSNRDYDFRSLDFYRRYLINLRITDVRVR